MAVRISGVEKHSIAQRHGIKNGDVLLKIGEEEICDVLDYRFYMTAKKLTLSLVRGETPYSVTVKKNEYDDLGLEFETYLMDKQRSCRNNCIFCFIDQNPKGMRESIYFKDDDDRLSFLFGNYITLTNLTDHDVDRILRMHISPINISVHTTDPELRVKMMHNRFAGSSLQRLYRLCEGNIKINTQLVLCPGYNDGAALERTLSDLDPLVPKIQSIACVPVGLTAYREGLTQLHPFTQAEAAQTIDTIEKYADRWFARHGLRVGYPADEFFLLAGRPIPPAEYYGDFANLENGVGLIANAELEFCGLLPLLVPNETPRRISVATGVAAGESIKKLCSKAEVCDPALKVEVYPIPSRFFGGRITVTGLVTGSDIIAELKGRLLGDLLIIPSCMLRREQDKFLDDTTPEEVSKILGIPVKVVQDDGASLAEALVE
ncbi:hypothetical protein SDC9_114481 [bioreactor metagenome]|uniref:Uncharacterized protein n=1 Tax=bioreactor metagenome TaxID=1076179 RepID=A0A645BR22_9ZZZZ